jgi:hypothetical protein
VLPLLAGLVTVHSHSCLVMRVEVDCVVGGLSRRAEGRGGGAVGSVLAVPRRTRVVAWLRCVWVIQKGFTNDSPVLGREITGLSGK